MTDTLFSPGFFAAVKSRTSQYSWARRALDRFIEQTSAKIDKPFDIPLLGGGWSHNYNCPNDGDRLQLVDRHHHTCSTCGSVWSGSPWDEVAVANEHWQYSTSCRDAAVAYGLTGENRWLDWAKRVLLFYADHYDQYPLHDKTEGQDKTSGKVQCQTLSESSWLVPLAQSFYILSQHQVLTEKEQVNITNRLFEPAINVIKQNPAGTSNWQTYHNAAKAWTAAATKNSKLMEEALQDPENGFYFQMELSLGEDGFWYEGSWGYHFYTLEAQVLIVLAADCFGIPLHENSRFRSMFRAPLASMFPDGKLPPVHDSGEVDIKRYAHLYEFAYSRWNEGREMISRSPRHFLYSLLFGTDGCLDSERSQKPGTVWSTQDLNLAGMLVVKRGEEDSATGSALMIDYGKHGGSHGHRDKMNVLYYAQGHPWLTDAGTVPYGNPMYKQYFKQTIPHNTVVIGGKSQAEAEGRLMYARETADGFELLATVDQAYPGTVLRRKLLLTDEYLLDIFQVESEQKQTIDWVIQTQGQPIRGDDSFRYQAYPDGYLGMEDGYSFLRSIQRVNPLTADWRMSWQWDLEEQQSDHLEIYGFSVPDPEELWIADSPAMPAIKNRYAFVRRRTGVSSTSIVTVFRACRAGDEPLRIQREERTGLIHVTGKNNQRRTFSTVIETD